MTRKVIVRSRFLSFVVTVSACVVGDVEPGNGIGIATHARVSWANVATRTIYRRRQWLMRGLLMRELVSYFPGVSSSIPSVLADGGPLALASEARTLAAFEIGVLRSTAVVGNRRTDQRATPAGIVAAFIDGFFVNRNGSSMDAELNSYDAVPYTNHSFSLTHPDHLATVATLFGLRPQPNSNYRVLEIGCALGGNLIPMAEQLPDCHFVGIDLSDVQISEAQKTAQAAGLRNIELKRLNIMNVDSDLGKFDYIICHGIYSWVPGEVQDKILDICASSLTPQGVAYVSYNTFPGWHMRGMIRDMMVYHTAKFDDPSRRIKEARRVLRFLSQTVEETGGAHATMLKAELEMLEGTSDAYLYHDHLEKVNEPIYFHQFVDRINNKKLQYLGEADLAVMFVGNFSEDTAKTLRELSTDVVQTEQYMDFARNRSYRQTLLCHADAKIVRSLDPSSIQGLHVTSPLVPAKPPVDVRSNATVKFKDRRDEQSMGTGDPLAKSALSHLADRWPESIAFDELVSKAMARAGARLATNGDHLGKAREAVAYTILRCYVAGLVELSTQPSRFRSVISKRPLAAKLARNQATDGSIVVNRRHMGVELNELDRHVLRRLDGKHDRGELLNSLVQLTDEGVLSAEKDGQAIESSEELRSSLERALAASLSDLAATALLVE